MGIRVFYYTGGPGDIIGAYSQEFLREEGSAPLITDVSVAFSNQFFEACEKTGASAYVVSPNPRIERMKHGSFELEHRSLPALCRHGGIRWHLGILIYSLGLIKSAMRFRAQFAFVGDIGHFWLWSLAGLAGIRVVPILHCSLISSDERHGGVRAKIANTLNGFFWRRHVYASVVVSSECERQIRDVAGPLSSPIFVGLSLFRSELFAGIPEPPDIRRPFRVMFAGRIEINKGVFDLLDIATILETRHPGDYIFEVCGHGSVFKELQDSVLERKLGKVVLLPGHFDRNQMMEAYGRSHCVIVPTKSTLIEGFNQVAVEAVMAGRPVIASRQCPSLELLQDASIEVPPDDIEAYVSAIQRLAEDEMFYTSKRGACAALVKPFFDYEQSWGYAIKRVLEMAAG